MTDPPTASSSGSLLKRQAYPTAGTGTCRIAIVTRPAEPQDIMTKMGELLAAVSSDDTAGNLSVGMSQEKNKLWAISLNLMRVPAAEALKRHSFLDIHVKDIFGADLDHVSSSFSSEWDANADASSSQTTKKMKTDQTDLGSDTKQPDSKEWKTPEKSTK